MRKKHNYSKILAKIEKEIKQYEIYVYKHECHKDYMHCAINQAKIDALRNTLITVGLMQWEK